jgi:hypothetical protein
VEPVMADGPFDLDTYKILVKPILLGHIRVQPCR